MNEGTPVENTATHHMANSEVNKALGQVFCIITHVCGLNPFYDYFPSHHWLVADHLILLLKGRDSGLVATWTNFFDLTLFFSEEQRSEGSKYPVIAILVLLQRNLPDTAIIWSLIIVVGSRFLTT